MNAEAGTNWKHAHISTEGSITVVRFHTDGGPLIWNGEVHQELPRIWDSLLEFDQTKVIILTGTGEVFCNTIESSAHRPWIDIWSEGHRLLSGLLNLKVPVVTLVNGPATIHSEIAVTADIVLASRNARFADEAHILRGYV